MKNEKDLLSKLFSYKNIRLLIGKKLRKFYKKYLKLKSHVSDKIITDPFQVVYIPTNLIQYKLENKNKRFLKVLHTRMVGHIKLGNWDINKELFDFPIKPFKERFIQKKGWEETEYYDLFLNEKNKTFRVYKSWEDFKKNCLEQWEKIYKSIKKEGYKSQKELKNKKYYCTRKINVTGYPENEIEVAISRSGEILFIDGRHRLAIAKILKIKKIPVIVNIWHKEYIDSIKNSLGPKEITPKNAIKPILDKKVKF
ncbi:MAG: hypothetical protein ACMXX8_03280 [Candidatus Woesearchaeota archaeon]